MSQNKQIVYVELDALLDTRLATVAKIDSDAAVTLVTGEEYFERQIDDFEALTGIDVQTFREAYKARDIVTLQASRRTQAPQLLHELITKLEMAESTTPYVEGLEVEVNVWPYELDNDEVDVLISAVMAFSGVETLVRAVRIQPADLTPKLIKDYYSGMIMYNFREWFELQLRNFNAVKIPDLPILAPAIWYEKIPVPDDYLSEGVKPNINPFRLCEVGLYDVFQLNLLPAEVFSFWRV